MTTPVGSIKFDLSIDGSGLPTELLREIQGAIAPVLADLQRRLDAVERDYQHLTREAEKSAAKQAAAAKVAAEAVEDIGDEHTKTAAKAQTSATVSTRSINAVTRAVERQVRAWEKLAAAQAAAAAAPQPGPPPPPTRGGGSGGGGGGGSRGGNVRWHGGRGGFIGSPVGLNTLAFGAAAIPPAISAATTAVVNLVGAIQQLTQAGLALPGVFAGAATSIGTAVIGFQGMADAVEALNEAAASGDPKDLEKAAEALKDMAPAAVETAKAVSAFVTGPWKDLQRATAQTMFDGVAKDFETVTGRLIPTLQRGTQEVGSAWNKTFKELGRVVGLDSTQSFLDRIFGNTAEAQTRANAAIEPLIHGIGTLTSESSDFLPRLADALTKVTTRFDNWISNAAANGDLDKWINEGFDAASNLGESLLNVLKIINDITTAAGGDGGFLKWLRDATTQLHEFLASDEGQEKLTNFFTEGREQAAKWLPILQDLGRLALDVFNGFRQWGETILPIVQTIAGVLASMPDSVTAVVTAFLAWRTISGVAALLGSISGIGRGIDALPGKANTAAGGISRALNRIAIPATLGPLLAGFTDQLIGPDQSVASNLAGGALNVAGGAALGANFGPWGVALGAMIGAGVTLFQATKDRLDAAKAEWEKAWQEDHDAGPTRPGSPEQQLTQMPELRGVRQPSLFNPDGSLKAAPDQQFADVIGSGKIPGAVINPDGTVTYNGVTIPNFKVPQPGTPTQQPYPLRTAPVQGPVAVPPPQVALTGGEQKPIVAPTDLGGLLGVPDVKQGVQQIASEIKELPQGEIKIKDPSPEVVKNLEGIDATITKVSENELEVKANTDKAQAQIDALVLKYKQQTITLAIQAQTTPPPVPVQPRAAGGPIFGGVPGRDSVPAMLMPGEHVLTVADVAAMGGHANVYAFRRALHFADGGEVPHLGTGLPPGPGDDNSVLGVLRQIRDLLAGRGGVGSNPLAETAANTANLSSAVSGGSGEQMGPFGTPLKPRNPGYEMAAAALSALGADPEKWIGVDPSTYVPPALAGGGALTAAGGGAVDLSRYIDALTAFARSGDLSTVSGLGLNANSSVITALTSARNKSKGGLSDEQIAELIAQVFSPGGYTGTLDTSNSSLIKSLTSFREKLAKEGGATSTGRGTAAVAGLTGVPMTALGMDPVSAYAAAHSGGQYQWGASDLAQGLSDCSGAVSDLVELITEGQATGKRLFSTADAGSVLKSLGAVEGALPGALQIGWDAGHMRATLPNGVPFESGGGTGQGATYGGNARGAEGMPNIMSLPVSGAIPGMTGAVGATGGGTPVFVTNWPGGATGVPGLDAILGGAAQGGGQAANNVIGDVMSAVGGLGNEPWNRKNVNYAQLNQLIQERNPMALAKLFGLDVPDFTRVGGAGDEITGNDGPGYDSSGRLFSNTSALLDRTFTNLNAQLQAMREQLVSVIEQTNQKLNEEALQPVVKSGVQSALEGLKDSVSNAIGTAMGQAAAPPIADAVRSAIPAQQGNPGGGAGTAIAGALFASGGPVSGGTPGKDSVPALLMPGEHVLTTQDVARMGGQAGVYAFRNALARHGGVRGFATGGGVIVNDTVGAEFFGVSQVPILGAIVNLLVRVLLAVLGVQIEARDTLSEITDEFRQFRGDFQAFDASGRLMNDTSALMERSQSSEELAAQERIRILKIVIQALVKYIIEKVIVPIAKAVANAAINAGASAAGAAINTQAPGAGGIVSSLISSAGSAGVDIIAEIGSEIAVQASAVIIDMIAQGLQSYFPDLVAAVFGGGLLEQLLVGPITAALEAPLAILGAFTGGIAGLFAPLLGILGEGVFDSGGVARGVGLMPKATIAPERVLSPQQTALFERMVVALERNPQAAAGNTTMVNAEINVAGGPDVGRKVRDGLLELL
ncbi:tape measure protein [Mycobacterium phage Mask]|nr:tape measure protein [Mycobacterium phage Sejanus]UVT31557.1 tape measure protein [Mycobacterium phage Mask]